MSQPTQWLLDATQATPALTPSAMARRDSMREMLQTAVVTRRRRRQAFRWAGAAALVAALTLAALPQTGGADTPGNRDWADIELVPGSTSSRGGMVRYLPEFDQV